MTTENSEPNAGETSAPWMDYAGMVESGDPNSSRKIDEVVYDAVD